MQELNNLKFKYKEKIQFSMYTANPALDLYKAIV